MQVPAQTALPPCRLGLGWGRLVLEMRSAHRGGELCIEAVCQEQRTRPWRAMVEGKGVRALEQECESSGSRELSQQPAWHRCSLAWTHSCCFKHWLFSFFIQTRWWRLYEYKGREKARERFHRLFRVFCNETIQLTEINFLYNNRNETINFTRSKIKTKSEW